MTAAFLVVCGVVWCIIVGVDVMHEDVVVYRSPRRSRRAVWVLLGAVLVLGTVLVLVAVRA